MFNHQQSMINKSVFYSGVDKQTWVYDVVAWLVAKEVR